MKTRSNPAPQYTQRQIIESAHESILQSIKPGDVIAQIGAHKWWQLTGVLSHFAIHYYQRHLFGKNSNWHFTHAMLYLDEENTFSVELPRATMKPLREYCLSEFSIYRLRLTELTPFFIEIFRKTAMSMVGEDYDTGQALDMVINTILGYPHQRRLKLFDFGRRKKVCSVGVRVVYEYLYQSCLNTNSSDDQKWLFQK